MALSWTLGTAIVPFIFLFQAEDGIRDLVRSRGLGDVYKRQADQRQILHQQDEQRHEEEGGNQPQSHVGSSSRNPCLLYTSDAADERSSVDLGGRRIIKKKKIDNITELAHV